MRPTLISISGFSSNSGKTTLICDLLKAFPGWEAIKISRGHYRSCGKSPEACCISPMLGERAVVLSGRPQTYSAGKDTGRFWDSGASNVHWVICTSEQLEEGLRQALTLVEGEGVFIEGTSVLKVMPVDYSVMVAGGNIADIKSSAVGVISKIDSIYIPRDVSAATGESVMSRLLRRGVSAKDLRARFDYDAERVSGVIREIHAARLRAEGSARV
jgi:molybdopterin-guanine dinucleotide biosynthesis protein